MQDCDLWPQRIKNTCDAKLTDKASWNILKRIWDNYQGNVPRGKTTVILWVPVQSQWHFSLAIRCLDYCAMETFVNLLFMFVHLAITYILMTHCPFFHWHFDIGITQEIPVKKSCPWDNTCNESCIENGESMYSVRFVKQTKINTIIDTMCHSVILQLMKSTSKLVNAGLWYMAAEKKKNTCDAKLVDKAFWNILKRTWHNYQGNVPERQNYYALETFVDLLFWCFYTMLSQMI